MPVTPEEFKDALGRFCSGVTVVTTRDAHGRPRGLTVSAFCSVSLDPPLVLISIDNRTEACAALRDSGVFGVSVLSEDQEEVSRSFANPGPEKFEHWQLDVGQTGVLLVPDAVARLECQVHQSSVAGDHTLFVGRVEQVDTGSVRPPLVYHAGGYRSLRNPGGA
jgi:flavin reductase (DIM6/NTAB) family NADH-FMN oxidoreductase RutF